jgi:NIPSNAP
MTTYPSGMTADHLSPDDSSRPTSTQPVVEVRTYRTKPGRRAEFVELFTSRGGPAQREYGMTVLGPLLDTEDPDTLVWLRAFPAAEERESIKTAFYDGPTWSQQLEDLILPLLADYSCVRVCSLPEGFLDGPLRSQDWR